MPSEVEHLDSGQRRAGGEDSAAPPQHDTVLRRRAGPASDASSPDGGARPSHLVPPRLIALSLASRDARSRMGPSSARVLMRLAMPPCASESARDRR